MRKNNRFLDTFTQHPWMAGLFSLLGLMVFSIQAGYYAHYFDVTMDEGTYLMKGLLFLRGDYKLFQDYGPWTNKMPLAFLIPGAVQMIFGPGLRTGRYFSIALAILMIAAIWIVTRRIAGKWWAALAVWVMALSSGAIVYYSQAISQVISACMLAWMMVFVLGDDRRWWQILVGTGLASLTVMTRQNMLPVVPILILYLFWQYGKKVGLLSLGFSVLLLGGFHALYWPDILKIWLPWTPKLIINWFNLSQYSIGGLKSIAAVNLSLWTRFQIFWEGFRIYFFILTGTVVGLINWPRKTDWKTTASFKSAILMLTLFGVLFFSHLWAALMNDYCIYCYSGYIAFFAPIGLILVIVLITTSLARSNLFARGGSLIALVMIAAGTGLNAYKLFGDWLMKMAVPRIKNLRFQPGEIELWKLFSNKFGWSYEFLERFLPGLFTGLISVIIILFLAFAYFVWLKKKRQVIFSGLPIVVFLILGSLFAFFPIPGGAKSELNCQQDVLLAHDEVGSFLKETIPEEALVYWENDVSPLPLLYLNKIKLFPAQLNHEHNRRNGGDPDKLARLGYWNEELALQWSREADYLLVADLMVKDLRLKGIIQPDADELKATQQLLQCRKQSIIHIYKNP
jgi:hypothetical protein